MRIVGGKYRGLHLEEPARTSPVRPTTDRVREAMASMILSYFDLDVTNVSVLDVFAGSGALGIEMLSRGAKHVTFLDSAPAQTRLVEQNLNRLAERDSDFDVGEKATVLRGNAVHLAQKGRLFGAPFNLVLLDPPYARDPALSSQVLNNLAGAGQLAKEALVIREHQTRGEALLLDTSANWKLLKQKEFGTITLDSLLWGGGDISC